MQQKLTNTTHEGCEQVEQIVSIVCVYHYYGSGDTTGALIKF